MRPQVLACGPPCVGQKTSSAFRSSKPPIEQSADATPIERLEGIASHSRVLVLVFYRGDWCPFSTTWARGLSSIRSLHPRLQNLDAHVIFVSAQSNCREEDTAEHFRFTEKKGLNRRIFFINDQQNQIAKLLNTRFGSVVCIDSVGADFASGSEYPFGMTQPALIAVRDIFTEKERVLDSYTYDSQGCPSAINGRDDSPQGCVVLRTVENEMLNLAVNGSG